MPRDWPGEEPPSGRSPSSLPASMPRRAVLQFRSTRRELPNGWGCDCEKHRAEEAAAFHYGLSPLEQLEKLPRDLKRSRTSLPSLNEDFIYDTTQPKVTGSERSGERLFNWRIYNPDTDCNRRNSFPDGSS